MNLPAPDQAALEPTSEVVRILEEYLEELQAGARLDPDELAARCPEMAGPLKSCLASLELLQEAALGLRGPGHPEQASAALPLPEIGRLGDFRIVRKLGSGGMGVVYEAEQLSLGRRVALKVLPFAAALDARQLQRFKNEALAAAGLHHGNIVPVYGVGCERGVHYYAMQLIEGQTLAALVDELRRGAAAGPVEPATPPLATRSTETSLGRTHFRTVARLGLQAAEALEHAHQLGVVHRDIKPANLLVDGRGNLWVTDFGLAHCHSLGELTHSGDLVGTLRYMSPEQALAQRVLLDHRTDIYSLGATLHELVTLAPPFDGHDRQELLRQIALEEPPAPRRLNRAVPVELETIVLKAMAKNPAQRYGTAQEMADDLRRFLEDKPIRARRPSWPEQVCRWARRHRPVVWSAALALLVSLAVLAGCAGWVVRDRAARRARMSAEADAALQEAERCQREGKWPQALAAVRQAEALLRNDEAETELSQRVQGLLREVAEQEADGHLTAALEEIRLRQAAGHGRESRFALEETLPEYRQAFREYGLRAETMTSAQAAALLRRRPEAVRAILLAALDHWLILARYRKAPEAGWLGEVLSAADPAPWRQGVRAARERNDRQALEKLAREVDVAAQPPEALFVLERGLRQRGAHQAAVTLLRRAQEAFPGDFWINHDLGMVLQECQPPRYEDAVRFLTVAVALRPDSPRVRLHFGVALWRKGQIDDAIATFRKVIARSPALAEAHGMLGAALAAAGRLDEAIAAYRQAVALKPDFAEAYANLGHALWGKHRLDDAVAAYRQAVEQKPASASAHADLGAALAATGQFDEAMACILRALELEPDCARAYHVLGNTLARIGRLDEAAAAQRRAIERQPDYAEAHCNLGFVLRKQGDLAQALAALKRGHELGSRRPRWPYPSAQWVQECQRLVEREGRLPAPPSR
jgi:serine/threonine protein kinase/Flp pilus assembly protein TadD